MKVIWMVAVVISVDNLMTIARLFTTALKALICIIQYYTDQCLKVSPDASLALLVY